MLNSLLRLFKPRSTYRDFRLKTTTLALRAESLARQLNHLPSTTRKPVDTDVVVVLKSTCLLMERLLEVSQDSDTDWDDEDSFIPCTTGDFVSPAQESIELVHEPKSAIAQEKPSSIAVTPKPEPSDTAMDLIKLRDWILLAQSNSTTPITEILPEIYKRLGQTLELENITPLEITGKFNYEQQQVVNTQVTYDPEQEDTICSTVRPGYLFEGKLIRPQEVTVYTYLPTDP